MRSATPRRAAEVGQAAAAASADAAEAVAGRVADAVESSGCVDLAPPRVRRRLRRGRGRGDRGGRRRGGSVREGGRRRRERARGDCVVARVDGRGDGRRRVRRGRARARRRGRGRRGRAANAAEDVADAADAVDASCGAACAAAAGAVASSANFLGKLEIVRDFYQVLSLFVVHAHRALTGALDWLAVLAGTISFDFDFVFDIPSGVWYAIGVTLGVIAIFIVVWLLAETSAQLEHHREREGNEFARGRTRTRRTTAACRSSATRSSASSPCICPSRSSRSRCCSAPSCPPALRRATARHSRRRSTGSCRRSARSSF